MVQCARELGVPVDDIMGDQLKKFGISPDQMEELEQNMAELAESGDFADLADDDNPALPDDGGAPSINIQKIINEPLYSISSCDLSKSHMSFSSALLLVHFACSLYSSSNS